MKKYQDVVTIIGPPGLIPIVGANVSVYHHGTQVTSTIYSDNFLTVTANPLRTDSSGKYSFYAADGRYDLNVTGNSIQTTLISDIALGDGFASVADYGAYVGASAATNTTAFNTALANNTVIFVPGELNDIYDLNALTTLTTARIIYGNGSTLRFNTTGDCISFNGVVEQAQARIIVRGLSFDNVTNVPTSFIRIRQFLNTLLQDLKFANCAATYCIDNVRGYGTQLRNVGFVSVTGNAVRMQNSPGAVTYSYAFGVDNCDFTQITGIGIDCQGANLLKVNKTVFEAIGGDAIVTSTDGSSVSQGIDISGCYFEANTGYDINLLSDGVSYWGRAVVTATVFAGSPTVNLGGKSKITFIGVQGVGGSPTVVTGSSLAECYLIGSEPGNFTQSGSYKFVNVTA